MGADHAPMRQSHGGTMEKEHREQATEREQRQAATREGVRDRESVASTNARLARRLYEELWNNRDFDGMARSASDDVESIQVPGNVTARGRDGYRQMAEAWAAAFPDGRVEITRVIADDSTAVVEFVGRGRHTGPLAHPEGAIAPTNRDAELSMCDVLEIRDGLVRRVRSYFDSATLMRQLGS
jgi:steroid delta-isomerase-like uncharacterized protein